MAFTPDAFSVLVQTLGGGEVRFFIYESADEAGTVAIDNYFENVSERGARVGDLVVVLTPDGLDTVGTFTNVSADGHGTVSFIAPSTGFYYTLTEPQFGLAQGDATTDDEASVDEFMEKLQLANGYRSGRVPVGTYLATDIVAASSAGFSIVGMGKSLSTFRRDSDGGSFFRLTSVSGAVLADFGLDLQFSVNGDQGHGIVLTDCDDVTVRGVQVTDFGNNGGSAGTGVIALPTSGTIDNVVYEDIYVNGDVATSTDTNGTLIVDGLYCRQHGILAKNIMSFGVEYKNNTQYSLMTDSIGVNCKDEAFGYGQTTAGDDGCDYNVAANLISVGSNTGFVIGEGDYNLVANMVIDSTGAAGPDVYGVHDSADNVGNAYVNLMTFGANMDFPIRFRSSQGYASIFSHDAAAKIVTMDTGASKNFTEILHPGSRTTIVNAINDVSGISEATANGNPVHCPMTGEWLGSVSGTFRWRLGHSAALNTISTQKFIFEDNADTILTLAVDATDGSTAGMQVAYGAVSNHAGFYYSLTSDFWLLRASNASVARFYSNLIRPEADDTVGIGANTFRFKDVWAVNGTIQTSDEREKEWLGPFSDAELRAARRISKLFGKYRWLSSIRDKGDAARIHCGVKAQDVHAAFAVEGLDAALYGVWCEDDLTDDDGKPTGKTRQALRMDELFSFILAANEQRLAALEEAD